LKKEYEKKIKENIIKYQGLNLYVKNLDDTWGDQKLIELFTPFGKITSACVMKDSETHASRGFGFVCYSQPEEASKAIVEMHNKMFGQKPLFVTLAQRKEQRRQELEQVFQLRQQGMMRGSMPQMYGQVYYPQSVNRGPYQPNSTKPRWNKERNVQTQKKTRGGSSRPNEGRQERQTGRGGKQSQGDGRDVKFNSNVKNKYPTKQNEKRQNTQTQLQPGLNSEYLASLSPNSQKQVLGETLYPQVQVANPELASKITGMLLEMDNGEILHLIESPEHLRTKISEAETVLKAHVEK